MLGKTDALSGVDLRPFEGMSHGFTQALTIGNDGRIGHLGKISWKGTGKRDLGKTAWLYGTG